MSVEPDPSTEPDSESSEPPSVLAAPSAVLDSAHLGDIEGALGTIRIADSGERTSLKRRLLTFAAILGPGSRQRSAVAVSGLYAHRSPRSESCPARPRYRRGVRCRAPPRVRRAPPAARRFP